MLLLLFGVVREMSLLAPIFFVLGEGLLMASSERGAGQRNETEWLLNVTAFEVAFLPKPPSRACVAVVYDARVQQRMSR
jgi:hypothetical protein